MKQRLALAQALMTDPQLVILDEPFAGVDPLGVRQMWARLETLREDGKTVILTSHLLGGIERHCDRVGLMHRGRLLMEETVSELLRDGQSSLDEVCIAMMERGAATS
ncbi:MAG: hypothetical protein J6386_21365 [Candidatus Synoicihabitans palmerolidicus]|nr:hypothetical protein [Candidatus Synoicihabitans palmerolidicus]